MLEVGHTAAKKFSALFITSTESHCEPFEVIGFQCNSNQRTAETLIFQVESR